MSFEAMVMAVVFVVAIGALTFVVCGLWWCAERVCWACRRRIHGISCVDLRGHACEACRDLERARWASA